MNTAEPADPSAPPTGRLSKHQFVQEQILDLIEGLRVGDPIPPERLLCDRFGVSRMTLRRAVDDIVREGHLVRRQGSGTYVAAPKLTQPLTMTSFSDEMRQRGMRPTSRTLSMTRTSAGPRIGRRLLISPSDPVVRIARLRLADDVPMAIEVVYLPDLLIPGIGPKDIDDGSLYELLARRYDLVVAAGTQTIEPTVTNEEESQALEVPIHSPAFLFRRTTRTSDDVIVESTRAIYRGDRYTISTELTPAGDRDGSGARTR